MKPVLTNTLRYQLDRNPALIKRNMATVRAPMVIAELKTQCAKIKMENPEIDALRFYMANHAVALLKQRVHPDMPLSEADQGIVDYYFKVLRDTVPRMFYYLLMITTREMRHTKVRPATTAKLKETLPPQEYTPFKSFFSNIRGAGSTGAVDTLKSVPPKTSLGNYTNGMKAMFYTGSFSGGFGGPAWGEVNDCLNEFVHGRITAEVMMDTAFTLCHNNGPIFNKGMLFHSYNSSEIRKILDVQRAGMIPQLIDSDQTSFASKVKEEHNELRGRVGNAFGGYVDWYQVESLGAMGSYPGYKKQQVDEHGMPEHVAYAEKLAHEQKLAAEAKKVADQLKEEKRYFVISNTEKVKKVTRENAA